MLDFWIFYLNKKQCFSYLLYLFSSLRFIFFIWKVNSFIWELSDYRDENQWAPLLFTRNTRLPRPHARDYNHHKLLSITYAGTNKEEINRCTAHILRVFTHVLTRQVKIVYFISYYSSFYRKPLRVFLLV